MDADCLFFFKNIVSRRSVLPGWLKCTFQETPVVRLLTSFSTSSSNSFSASRTIRASASAICACLSFVVVASALADDLVFSFCSRCFASMIFSRLVSRSNICRQTEYCRHGERQSYGGRGAARKAEHVCYVKLWV